MEIKLQEKELKILLSIVNMSTGIMGYMNDFIEDSKIATRARVWQQIEQQLLKQAYEQGLTGTVDFEQGRYYVKNELFEKNMELTDDYTKLSTHQELSHALAARDFHEAYTPAEIAQMVAERGEYLGVETYDFEEKYWKEFEERGYTRLRIVISEVEGKK